MKPTCANGVRMAPSFMRTMPWLLALATALVLVGCGSLDPESEAIRDQQTERSMLGPHAPPVAPSPTDATGHPLEPVPGEIPDY
jgi:hypothetical protein